MLMPFVVINLCSTSNLRSQCRRRTIWIMQSTSQWSPASRLLLEAFLARPEWPELVIAVPLQNAGPFSPAALLHLGQIRLSPLLPACPQFLIAAFFPGVLRRKEQN